MNTTIARRIALPILLLAIHLPRTAAALDVEEAKAMQYLIPPEWETDYEKAYVQSLTTGKRMLAVMSTPQCFMCKLASNKLYPTPEFKEATKDFVMFYVDIDADVNTKNRFDVHLTPTYIIFSPTGEPEDRLVGYNFPEAFVRFVKGHEPRMKRIEELRKQLSTDPKNAANWKELGDLYVKDAIFYPVEEKKPAEGLKAYERAVENDPGLKASLADEIELYGILNSKLYEDLAMTADSAKPLLAKLEAFEKAHPDSPHLPESYFYRALVIDSTDRHDLSLELMKEARAKFPESPFRLFLDSGIELLTIFAEAAKANAPTPTPAPQ